MSIDESEVGLSVAATRQNEGTFNGAGAGACAAPPPPLPPRPRPPASGAGAGAGAAGVGFGGGVKIPAGTTSANVMVVFGSEIDLRLAHGVGAASVALKRTTPIAEIITWT